MMKSKIIYILIGLLAVSCLQNELNLNYDFSKEGVYMPDPAPEPPKEDPKDPEPPKDPEKPKDPEEPKKPEDPKDPEKPKFTIVGERKGYLRCKSCCDPEYNFDLEITDYLPKLGHQIMGTLKISTKKNRTIPAYALFKVTGTYRDGVLMIETGQPYEIKKNSCIFCVNNTYMLKKQEDGSFKGTWLRSSCDSQLIKTAEIYLNNIKL